MMASSPTSSSDQMQEAVEEVCDHHAKLGEHAAILWRKQFMNDVTVVVDGQHFAAHKAVLTCYSPFFKKTFLRPGGSTINIHMTVRLEGMDHESFRVLLEYMYTGELQVCCKNLIGVYKAARKLEMEEAMHKCSQILSGGQNDCENIVAQYVTARQLGMKELHLRALGVVLELFEGIVLSHEFLHLSLDELVEILSQDTIGARSEIAIYLAAVKWLNYELPSRAPYLMDVMRCVRFQLMAPEEILHCYYPPLLPPEMTRVHAFRDLLQAGLCYCLARHFHLEGCFSGYGCSPRTYTSDALPIILWDLSKNDVNYHSPAEIEKAATKIQSMTRGFLARLTYRRALAKRQIAARTLQAYWRVHVVRKLVRKWTRMPEIPAGRLSKEDAVSVDPFLHKLLYHDAKRRPPLTKAELVHHFPMNHVPKATGPFLLPQEETLLALGGINPTAAEDEFAVGQMVLRYRPATDLWERIGTMPVLRHHHCTVLLHNEVYVIGGCDPRLTFRQRMVATREVFKLNVRTGQWSRSTPMLEARVYHGAATINGVIYVVGGKNEFGRMLASVECYDPAKNEWWPLDNPLCCPRLGAGVATYKGLLWVAGGFVQPPGESRVFVVRDVECYDPISNRWLFTCSRIPVARVFSKLMACDDHLYLVGGCGPSQRVKGDTSDTSKGHHPAMTLLSINEFLQYDPQGNHWLQVESDLGIRHDVAVASIGCSLYSVGGLSTQLDMTLDEVICHEAGRSSWNARASLPLPTVGVGLVTLPSL